jgi:hypothetical protein
MLKFNEFLNEAYDEMLEVDAKHLLNNIDAINAKLDNITEKPYQNAPIFLAQLRGALEIYGVLLPASATVNFLNLDAELVYMLANSDHYLYIIYNTRDDGYVDGYAQVVDNSELQDLIGMTVEDYSHKPMQPRPRHLPARYDSDGSNAADYDPPLPGTDPPRVEPNLPANIPNP